MKSAFFTGHRNYSGLNDGINCLIDFAITQGVNHFYSGMALGTDLIAAKLLSDRHLKWTAVIPFWGQTARWSQTQQRQYEQLLPQATNKIVLYKDYCPQSYHERNDYMITKSAFCLAVYDGRPEGGTASVIKKVKQLRKNLIVFNPKKGTFTRQLTIA
ncbi:MAG: SLOG family protein [Snowella sp.]|nr:SLOG family protein [Snowella sp.]